MTSVSTTRVKLIIGIKDEGAQYAVETLLSTSEVTTSWDKHILHWKYTNVVNMSFICFQQLLTFVEFSFAADKLRGGRGFSTPITERIKLDSKGFRASRLIKECFFLFLPDTHNRKRYREPGRTFNKERDRFFCLRKDSTSSTGILK